MDLYRVTISGIGKKPLKELYQAKSPGYAGRLAMDKYGEWIRITDIKLQKRGKTPKPAPPAHHPPATTKPNVGSLREEFNRNAKRERVRRRNMRRRTAALIDSSDGSDTCKLPGSDSSDR